MSDSVISTLHAFERALFLNARTMKTAAALGALGVLAVSLENLAREAVVEANLVARVAVAEVQAQLVEITAALEAGAQDVAVALYANLLDMIPAAHALVAKEIGHITTDPALLASAAERALAILGS